MVDDRDDDKPVKDGDLSRRTALARLGLGAAVAYSAPVILHLDRSANATVRVTPCAQGRGRKAPWCDRRDNHDRGDGRGRHDDWDRDHDHDRHRDRDRSRDHDRGRSGGRGRSNGRGRG